MKTAATLLAALGLTSAANAGVTLDDLARSTALYAGSTSGGDTYFSSDDMDGNNGIGSGGDWSGGDDVFSLEWVGGDFQADLRYLIGAGDLDMFLWGDNMATVLIGEGVTVDDDETISVAGLAAGQYYISVDGYFSDYNQYELRISDVPSPASAALLGLGGLVATRRRRA